MSREIKSTLGYSAIVDDADYELLSQFRWYAHNGSSKGRSEKRPARRTKAAEGRKVLFLVHHIIKPVAGMVIDHINGNPWDNRRENLRVCTHAQNLKNRRTRKARPGLLKGVQRSGNLYRAFITCDGESFRIGSFPTLEEAALAYDAAAMALHGEFAALNFPDAGTVARHPVELRAAIMGERDAATAAVAGDVAEMFRAGMNAIEISKALNIPASRARCFAVDSGITLRRGRPRKEPSPSHVSRGWAA